MTTPDTEWEKEFDEKFVISNYEADAHAMDTHIADQPDEIKSFITNLLSSRDTYRKEREKEAYKKGYAECEKEYGVGEEYGLGEGY